MTKEQVKKLWEITKKELDHSSNMMEELVKIKADNETLKQAKTYLSKHIYNCEQILSDIKNMEYMTIRGKEVVIPFELQDNTSSDNIINW